ncbi:hypothetical protein GN958_ATG08817 [Phytophthora infestans]|uniref:Uncharacterized protein n=1 Tax=Phytophthora infestans TaxID=4787 RepID=A0A8S9UUP7_PHYIN|nr:hypothetical protein GN958_ATG08817 [Phytophthora infestans]
MDAHAASIIAVVPEHVINLTYAGPESCPSSQNCEVTDVNERVGGYMERNRSTSTCDDNKEAESAAKSEIECNEETLTVNEQKKGHSSFESVRTR